MTTVVNAAARLYKVVGVVSVVVFVYSRVEQCRRKGGGFMLFGPRIGR